MVADYKLERVFLIVAAPGNMAPAGKNLPNGGEPFNGKEAV